MTTSSPDLRFCSGDSVAAGDDDDDDSETEVFFGPVSEQERRRAAKYNRRRTTAVYRPDFREGLIRQLDRQLDRLSLVQGWEGPGVWGGGSVGTDSGSGSSADSPSLDDGGDDSTSSDLGSSPPGDTKSGAGVSLEAGHQDGDAPSSFGSPRQPSKDESRVRDGLVSPQLETGHSGDVSRQEEEEADTSAVLFEEGSPQQSSPAAAQNIKDVGLRSGDGNSGQCVVSEASLVEADRKTTQELDASVLSHNDSTVDEESSAENHDGNSSVDLDNDAATPEAESPATFGTRNATPARLPRRVINSEDHSPLVNMASAPQDTACSPLMFTDLHDNVAIPNIFSANDIPSDSDHNLGNPTGPQEVPSVAPPGQGLRDLWFNQSVGDGDMSILTLGSVMEESVLEARTLGYENSSPCHLVPNLTAESSPEQSASADCSHGDPPSPERPGMTFTEHQFSPTLTVHAESPPAPLRSKHRPPPPLDLTGISAAAPSSAALSPRSPECLSAVTFLSDPPTPSSPGGRKIKRLAPSTSHSASPKTTTPRSVFDRLYGLRKQSPAVTPDTSPRRRGPLTTGSVDRVAICQKTRPAVTSPPRRGNQSPAPHVYRRGTPRHVPGHKVAAPSPGGHRHKGARTLPLPMRDLSDETDAPSSDSLDVSVLDSSILLQEKKVELERLHLEKIRLQKQRQKKSPGRVPPSTTQSPRPPLHPTTADNLPKVRFNNKQALSLSEPELDAITLVHTLCNSQQVAKIVTKARATTVVRHTPAPTVKPCSRLSWSENLVTHLGDSDDDDDDSSDQSEKRPVKRRSILTVRNPNHQFPYNDQPSSPVVVTKGNRRATAFIRDPTSLV